MKTIYKYPLEIKDEQTVKLPLNSNVISVINQNEIVMLYATVDTSEKQTETHNIRIFGTGHHVQLQNHKFVGTVVCHDGTLIWHVYCRKD